MNFLKDKINSSFQVFIRRLWKRIYFLFYSRRNSLNICFCLIKCCPHFLRNGNNPALAALSVLFGGIFNIFGDYFFVFVCSTSVYGAGNFERIIKTLALSILTTAFFGVFWTALSMSVPNLYIKICMSPPPEILSTAPKIMRTYALSFMLLPFNIFSTYYFQAIIR